jgi:hypothetical protein
MTMKTVDSTLIGGIGYNPLTEQLSVALKSAPSTTYVFRGVSRATANGFAESTSKGQYFNRNIRGRFPTSKVAS